MTDTKPYPSYKPSGVPRLGDVPEHWEVRRLKHWVGINEAVLPETTGPDFEFRYLEIGAVGTGMLVSKPITTRFGSAPSRARRIVKTGDTIVSTVRTYLKATWFAEEVKDDLICSTGFAVLTPSKTTYPTFVTYLVHSNAFTDQVTAASVGTAYPAIAESQLGSFHVSLPPLAEQLAIVRYLDHVDRRIRRYIDAKRKLIALLEEERQAIINQAVTRGLDPNVKLKPSGVEWLGDVPKKWKAVPLQRITLDRCDGPFGSGLKSSHYTDEGIRVVRLQNIGHGEFNDSDAAFISPEHYTTLGDHSVEAGDVLIAGLGDPNHPPGRACVAPESIVPAMVKADCFRFRLNPDLVNPEFIALQLTATATAASAILSTGATRQRTNLRSTSARHSRRRPPRARFRPSTTCTRPTATTCRKGPSPRWGRRAGKSSLMMCASTPRCSTPAPGWPSARS